jgi:peptide deformylase
MKPTDCKDIVTLPHPCLTTKATAIPATSEGLAMATEIIKDLENTLRPRMPAAGLAAPQIGISKCVMIFSWDRSIEHLEAAINPSYKPLDAATHLGWEGCFSVPLMLTQVSRYQTILATYTKLDGQQVRSILRGFAARVFQHETDHLDGLETVHKEGAKIRHFKTHEELIAFLTEVKKGDQAQYIEPEPVDQLHSIPIK